MFFLKELPSREMIAGYAQEIPEDGQEDMQRALVMMRDASLLVRMIERHLAKARLSQLQFLVLMVIDREPERRWLYQTEVVQRLDVSKPVLTRAVQTLVQAGFLLAAQDAQDRRAKRLSLSAAGKALLIAQLPGYFSLIRDFMQERGAV
ncbi:MAG: MarR family winged helix-turn-helix transcriptional regulator [Sulfitobacter sp.]